MSSIVTAERLSKTFQVKVRDPGLRGALRALFRPHYRDVLAVRDVTFGIDPGEIVAFLGPNGAGKTTTLKMLAGLLYPTGGRVEVAGFIPWTGGPAFKRRIALVLGNRQQLVWDLPPEETFLLNRAIYDIPEGEYRGRLAELVALLELGDVLQKPVRQLSLGERMKCELVASLLHRPPLASRVLMINRGRLLYDGALEALVARIARTKRIELVLGGGDGNRVTAEALAAFGEVKSFHFPQRRARGAA